MHGNRRRGREVQALPEDASRIDKALNQVVPYVSPSAGAIQSHYVITLYALSAPVSLSGVDFTAGLQNAVEGAMAGTIIASTTLGGWDTTPE